jgi:hypothetical protein
MHSELADQTAAVRELDPKIQESEVVQCLAMSARIIERRLMETSAEPTPEILRVHFFPDAATNLQPTEKENEDPAE